MFNPRLIKFILVSAAVTVVSCSTEPKMDSCPTSEEEPISVCRAKKQCEDQTSNMGVGLGLGMGVGMGSFGVGVGRKQASDRYEKCLNRNLEDQEKHSKEKKDASKNS